jgi:hypothetical protein
VEVPGRSERDIGREQLESFVEDNFGEEIHTKWVTSLIDGVDRVLHAATLGIRAIRQGVVATQGPVPKYAIKQGTDRPPTSSWTGRVSSAAGSASCWPSELRSWSISTGRSLSPRIRRL